MAACPVVAIRPVCSVCAARSPYRIAALAHQSLRAEAELTPKPGLVDRRGSGSHKDLSLELMLRSANTLEPYFALMGLAAEKLDLKLSLRQMLVAIGRAAECAMLKATQGSNSHKGAIWALGLLVTAAVRAESQSPEEITAIAAGLAQVLKRTQPELITHGDIVRERYGVGGAREEASNGFPHVLRYGLPALRLQRSAGYPEEVCRLNALLSLMSEVDDTCLVYRGGWDGLQTVKAGALDALYAGGYGTFKGRVLLRKLDRELVERQLSPGGSADLLAATIFLDAVDSGAVAVRSDRSELEEIDGAA